jgi:geranylgeranyl diphosphate synthase, type II
MNSLKNKSISPDIMTFKHFQAFYSPIIETDLENSIPTADVAEINILANAIKHSLLNGGKRIRPLLTIASNNLFSENYKEILPLASALECIHTYGLIHDDLPAMDDDDFRRGKPTCHVKFGEDIAILAGDTLNTLAFEIISSKLNTFPADALLTVLNKVCKLTGFNGVVGGQVIDIQSHKIKPSATILNHLHSKKTGALIDLCILCPAILHQVDSAAISKLTDFSTTVGLLFQIIDDILDVEGDKESLGKTPGKDDQLNKLTYPSLFGLQKSKEIAQEKTELSFELLSSLHKSFGYNIDNLKDIVQFIFSRSY